MSVTIANLGIAQVPIFEKDLNLDSLMFDSKVQSIKNQLPEGWQLQYFDKRIYILYHEKVWFPISYVSDSRVIGNTTSYEYRNGKKVIVVEANPCFILEVMPIWTKEQWKDTILYNDKIWKQGSLAKEKIKRVPSHLTEKFNLFLESEYGYKDYLPTFIFREMNEIRKKINQSWAITF
ncbi:hypothetical protein [Dyadobacter sp. 32]|uniref:hypothetical protein n=1 Tax=Dyadobacter sp. 32 TaxID=538966 RepID=UPI0039C6A55D